jgi:hypothetical protein
MRTCLLRIFSLLLLIIFLYNLGGYFVAFRALQYQVKKEIKTRLKQGVPDSELELITVSADPDKHPADFHKIDRHEVKYRGSMYDIVRTEHRGDSIYYHCIKDEDETRLFAGLDGHVKREISLQSASGKQSAKTLKNHIKDYLQPKQERPLPIYSNIPFPGCSEFALKSAPLQHFTPPPEIV